MWNQGAKVLGLVGAKKAENHGVPFNLTEEFAAVYRLHPLMPDTLPVQGASVDMTELLGDKGTHAKNWAFQSIPRYPYVSCMFSAGMLFQFCSESDSHRSSR